MTDKYVASLDVCSVNSIYQDLTNKDSQIDLDAEYQRDIVWDDNKMRYYIDSLNVGIIPTNLIFNINDETGSKTCMDGKQRITSIKKFMENDELIYLTDPNDDEKRIYYSKVPEGCSNSRTFIQREKTDFINRKIPVVTYKNLDYNDQIDIFNRIQNGKALTAGELILSQSQFSEDIVKKYKQLCNGKRKTDISHLVKTDRNNHFIFFTELMMLLIDGLGPINKQKRDKFMKNIKDAQDLTTKFKPVDKMITKLFNETILYNDKIKAMPKIKNTVLYIIIYSIYCKYKLNYDKIDEDSDLIVNTICKLLEEKIQSGKDEKIVKHIFNRFNKLYYELKTLQDDTTQEISNDSTEEELGDHSGKESEDESSEEEINLHIVKKSGPDKKSETNKIQVKSTNKTSDNKTVLKTGKNKITVKGKASTKTT